MSDWPVGARGPAGAPVRPLLIVVCVKPVPDTGRTGATGSGGAADGAAQGSSGSGGALRVDRQGVPLVPDRGDRVALEAALRLKEEVAARSGAAPAGIPAAGSGAPAAVVHALLMGPPAAEGAARQCLALGADEAWLLSDRALAGSDAQATARALAAALRHIARNAGAAAGGILRPDGDATDPPAAAPDLVLTGIASSDGGTGQVGPALAVHLGLAYLPETRELPGRPGEALPLPALATIPRDVFLPRAATMLGIARARSRPFRTLDCAACAIDPAAVGERGSPTRVSRLLPYQPRSRAEMLPGEPAEQARAMVRLLGAATTRRGPSAATEEDAAVRLVAGWLEAKLGGPAGSVLPLTSHDLGPGCGGWLAHARALAGRIRSAPEPPLAVLFPSTRQAADLAAALAATLGTGLVSHCLELRAACAAGGPAGGPPGGPHGGPEWEMLVPAFGAMAAITCPEARPVLVTLAPGAARRMGLEPPGPRDRPADAALALADVVVAGGAGAVSPDVWPLVERVARALGATVGATRPVVDQGLAREDQMIGQSGRSVAPDLYLALGISGDLQHTVGFEGAGTVIAVNRDPAAPIFGRADYGAVARLEEFLPALLRELER